MVGGFPVGPDARRFVVEEDRGFGLTSMHVLVMVVARPATLRAQNKVLPTPLNPRA